MEKEKEIFPFAKASTFAEASVGKSEDKKATVDKDRAKIEDLKKTVEEAEKLKAEYLAGWQRAQADLINYKKEEMERFEEIIRFANLEFILRLLPLLDNLLIAEKKLPEELKKDENVKGLLQIKVQLEDFLKAQGIEPMESLGKKFDPNCHEAVEEINPTVAPSFANATADRKAMAGKGIEPGTIVEEVQRGYLIEGKTLRPAKVKVSK